MRSMLMRGFALPMARSLASTSSSGIPVSALNFDALKSSSNSRDEAEIAKFASASAEWWDPHGQFAMLHRMNPVRVRYIRDFVERSLLTAARSGEGNIISIPNVSSPAPFSGLKMLDIGCGGGLLSESLARLGAAQVVGVDASPENISMATFHLEKDPLFCSSSIPLRPQYIAATAEQILDRGGENQFDVVCGLEIIEHVRNPKEFVATCVKLVKPSGLVFFSTINRTTTSFLFTVLLAEYVLRWVPPGTHDHSKYVTPIELAEYLGRAGADIIDMAGLSYDLSMNKWDLQSEDDGFGSLDMNYILVAKKNST